MQGEADGLKQPGCRVAGGSDHRGKYDRVDGFGGCWRVRLHRLACSLAGWLAGWLNRLASTSPLAHLALFAEWDPQEPQDPDPARPVVFYRIYLASNYGFRSNK